MKNRVRILESVYKIDEKNKVVVCELKVDMQMQKNSAYYVINRNMWRRKLPYVNWEGQFTVRAKARCNATDTFSVETGKRIAESRAKVKMFNTAWKVYRECEDALVDLAQECQKSSQACVAAMNIEDNHVLELTR